MTRAAIRKTRDICFLCLFPLLIFWGMEWFLRNPFMEKWGIRALLQLINLIFFYLLEFFFYALTGSLRTSLYILSVPAFVFGLCDHYVYLFRGNTIVPWDLMSLGTALSVSGDYDYKPDRTTILVILYFLILWISLFFCKSSIRRKRKLRLKIVILSALMLFLIYIPFVQSEHTVKTLKIYDKLFTPATMTMRDGMAYAFLYDLQFLKVKKPPGYNRKKTGSALKDKYGEGTTVAKGDENTPNIIVVMCEAFSDPGVLTEFEVNKDYMPFIRSLYEDDNCISGNLNVSVLGGNTPNTEFEFLTGSTMAFLPAGSIPFQQFIRKRTDAIPSYLSEMGYNTEAMHPYKAGGWDRNRVYPLLGFDNMFFLDHFMGNEYGKVRKYVSDEALFNEIINRYKKNGKKSPFFSFNVTMQNHSDYTEDFDNFDPDIEVTGLDNVRSIERYLSLEKLTDNAFKDLISYFDSISDPSIVVFFGDHQPTDSVVEPLLNLNGKSCSDLNEEELMLRYKVPFFIWANYDIAGEKDLDISANYLGNLVLKTAGLELKGYRAFLEEQYRETPVVTPVRTVHKDGSDETTDIKDPALQNYRCMQYYVMFDK